MYIYTFFTCFLREAWVGKLHQRGSKMVHSRGPMMFGHGKAFDVDHVGSPMSEEFTPKKEAWKTHIEHIFMYFQW